MQLVAVGLAKRRVREIHPPYFHRAVGGLASHHGREEYDNIYLYHSRHTGLLALHFLGVVARGYHRRRTVSCAYPGKSGGGGDG